MRFHSWFTRLVRRSASAAPPDFRGPGPFSPAFSTAAVLETPPVLPPAELFLNPPTVWFVDEPACEPYEEFVATHPQGTFYHGLAWRAALTRAGCGRPFYLLALRGARAAGAWPLFETTGADGARIWNSLPATPAAGLLAEDETIRILLWERACHVAQRRGVREIRVRTFSRPDSDARACASNWARFPLDLFLGNDETAAACAGERFGESWTVPLTSDLLDEFSSIVDCDGARSFERSSVAILAALCDSAAPPLCTLVREPNGRVAALGVWARLGRHAHVFAYRRSTASSLSALLRRIAQQAAEGGARWLDCAVPRRPDAEFARRLAHALTQKVREEVFSPRLQFVPEMPAMF